MRRVIADQILARATAKGLKPGLAFGGPVGYCVVLGDQRPHTAKEAAALIRKLTKETTNA